MPVPSPGFGLPSLRVMLNPPGVFGADDPAAVDISPWLHLPSGWSITRGRQQEFGSVQAGQLSFTLHNPDGRFTLGIGNVAQYQQVRFYESVGGVETCRFTGFVEDWPQAWSGQKLAARSVVQITAMDKFAAMSRHQLRSMLEEEILAAGPSCYWTLGDPEGATEAAESSGNCATSLRPSGSGAPMTFGGGIGPVDGLSAAQFYGGQYLGLDLGPTPVTVAFFVAVAAGSTKQAIIGEPGESGAYGIDSNGRFAVSSLGLESALAPTVIADGRTHFIIMSSDGKLYIDGVLAPSSLGLFSNTITIGGTPPSCLSGTASWTGFVGTMSHVATFPGTLSTAQIAAIYAASLAAPSWSDDRIRTLATFGRVSTGAIEAPAATVAAQTGGTDVVSAMEEVRSVEGGDLFIDPQGLLAFYNRRHRTTTAHGTPKLALALSDVQDDLTIATDMQLVYNRASGQAAGGGVQVVQDAASIAARDLYPYDAGQTLQTDDTRMTEQLGWIVNTYAQPRQRLATVTLDLLTLPPTTQVAALGVELADRLTVSGMPSQSPFATADVLAEGFTESGSDTAWGITFNTSPAALWQSFMIDDPTWGVIDSSTPIGW